MFWQDILYDDVNRGGLIQTKLRQIHRNTTKKNPTKRKATPVVSGGPRPKLLAVAGVEEKEVPEELALLNSAGPKTAEAEIEKFMVKLLPHRNNIRRVSASRLLLEYPKFKELSYLVITNKY